MFGQLNQGSKTTRKKARGRFLRGPGVKDPLWGSTGIVEIRTAGRELSGAGVSEWEVLNDGNS